MKIGNSTDFIRDKTDRRDTLNHLSLIIEDIPMGKNVAQKLIETHLVDGNMQPGEEIGLKIDQTLTQDATGTMVMLEFEAMQIHRVKTEA